MTREASGTRTSATGPSARGMALIPELALSISGPGQSSEDNQGKDISQWNGGRQEVLDSKLTAISNSKAFGMFKLSTNSVDVLKAQLPWILGAVSLPDTHAKQTKSEIPDSDEDWESLTSVQVTCHIQ